MIFMLECGHRYEVHYATTVKRWWCCGRYQEVVKRDRGYDILDVTWPDPIWPDATQASAVLRTGKRVVTIQVRDGLL